jgi:exopolysaccharide biosynthesis polyprenyl glycosylphosphotransferase
VDAGISSNTALTAKQRVPMVQRLTGLSLHLGDRRLILFVGDTAAALAATVAALWLWTFTSGHEFGWPYLLRERLFWLVVTPCAWVLIANPGTDLRHTADVRSLAGKASAALGLYLVAYFLLPRNALPRLYVLYFVALATAAQLAWRWIFVSIVTSTPFRRRVLILGGGWAGEAISAALAEHCPREYEVVGVIEDAAVAEGRRLLDAARSKQAGEIVVANSGEVDGPTFQALLDCQAEGIAVTPMPNLYERVTGRMPIAYVGRGWMVSSFIDRVRSEQWFQLAKRLIDIGGALIGLAGLALIFPLVAGAIWIESGRPIFFRQARLGQGGQLFTLYKFRTMRAEAEGDGQARWAGLDDGRVTQIGKCLRRTHLDEAPQFWNVLKGEMSLVGPRPERPEFYEMLEAQIPFYRARLLVRPGITGWAQVNYPYSHSVNETATKLQYDLYYVKHQSLWLDVTILARTVGVVLAMQGT